MTGIPTDPEPRLGLEVTLKSQPAQYRNAVTDYEQFYLIAVTRGVLRYSDPSTSVEVEPGRMVVLRVGSSFTLSTDAAGYSGIAIEIRQLTDALLHGSSFVAAPSARIAAAAEWIESELSLPQRRSPEIVASLGHALVALSLRESDRTAPGEPSEARSRYWARRAREAIHNSIYANQSVRQTLRRFPVSYRQIARYTYEAYGASPKALQLEARMSEARRLLRETRWSVTTIALELGFSSAQHFITAFRLAYGEPPGAWRARLTERASGRP